mmetsp:Transcript_14071/g.21338  ORF Transcript_14071/g.21338 Transcript_14071/m.21338 type:complete len:83 (+) Transcript_14071:3852-4100(+)
MDFKRDEVSDILTAMTEGPREKNVVDPAEDIGVENLELQGISMVKVNIVMYTETYNKHSICAMRSNGRKGQVIVPAYVALRT